MHLKLFAGQTVGDIQQVFSHAFPYLKIDFFKNLELNGIRITKKLEPPFTISKPENAVIELEGSRTISAVKNDFLNLTGLASRIFRKSGNVWIETSLTDDWTLNRQNAEGAQFHGI
jgi:hypothetical protein